MYGNASLCVGRRAIWIAAGRDVVQPPAVRVPPNGSRASPGAPDRRQKPSARYRIDSTLRLRSWRRRQGPARVAGSGPVQPPQQAGRRARPADAAEPGAARDRRGDHHAVDHQRHALRDEHLRELAAPAQGQPAADARPPPAARDCPAPATAAGPRPATRSTAPARRRRSRSSGPTARRYWRAGVEHRRVVAEQQQPGSREQRRRERRSTRSARRRWPRRSRWRAARARAGRRRCRCRPSRPAARRGRTPAAPAGTRAATRCRSPRSRRRRSGRPARWRCRSTGWSRRSRSRPPGRCAGCRGTAASAAAGRASDGLQQAARANAGRPQAPCVPTR